jgi:hypothetical protein
MEKLNKKFGIWMDTHHATIAGNNPNGDFTILAHITDPGSGSNSSENARNHLDITLTHKYFKDISVFLLNAEEIFVTGTGQIQEQFIKYLAATPQFKKAKTSETTSGKMEDSKFLELVASHFNSVLYPS